MLLHFYQSKIEFGGSPTRSRSLFQTLHRETALKPYKKLRHVESGEI